MLHSLEVLARGKEGAGYMISPRLLNPDKLRAWRTNLMTSGAREDKVRYLNVIDDPRVMEKLGLSHNHGS